jgi:hypothetical protein
VDDVPVAEAVNSDSATTVVVVVVVVHNNGARAGGAARLPFGFLSGPERDVDDLATMATLLRFLLDCLATEGAISGRLDGFGSGRGCGYQESLGTPWTPGSLAFQILWGLHSAVTERTIDNRHFVQISF